jgi:hypothetical protein
MGVQIIPEVGKSFAPFVQTTENLRQRKEHLEN